MDPFTLPLAHFEYTRNPQIRGFLNVKNSKTYGISQGKINAVRSIIDDKNLDIAIDVSFPKIFMQGLYKGEANFNEIKLSSKGSYNVTMSV